MWALIRNTWPRRRCDPVGALSLRPGVNPNFTESWLTNFAFRFLIMVRRSATAGSTVTYCRVFSDHCHLGYRTMTLPGRTSNEPTPGGAVGPRPKAQRPARRREPPL
jgi:hypothetical protein